MELIYFKTQTMVQLTLFLSWNLIEQPGQIVFIMSEWIINSGIWYPYFLIQFSNLSIAKPMYLCFELKS